MSDKKYSLCYLHIMSSGFLKNIEFNFMSDRKFSIKQIGDKNWELIEEKISEIKMPNNFFGSSISNISAIVGKNGSGKTSIIDFFTKHTCKSTYFYEGDVSIWQNENGVYKIIHNLNSLNFENRKLESVKFDLNFPEVMLFSNVFDGRYSERNYANCNHRFDNLLKVTDYTLNTYVKTLQLYNSDTKTMKALENNFIEKRITEDAVAFMNDEKFRQIMSSDIQSLPNALSLKVLDSPFWEDDEPEEYKKIEELNKNLETTKGINSLRYHNLCLEDFDENNINSEHYYTVDEQRSCYEIIINKIGLMLWLVSTIILKKDQLYDSVKINTYIDTLKSNVTISENAVTILLGIIKNEKNKSLDDIEKLLNFIIDNFKYENCYDAVSENEIGCKFKSYKNNDIALQLYKNASKILKTIKEITPTYLDIFELKLAFANGEGKISYSSGELMKFRLFVELYKAYRSMSRNTAILIVDELDLYLHPSMQQKSISDIIQFINTFF